MVPAMPRTEAGALIRARREAAHLDQAQVAERLALTAGAVSQWETGRTLPRRRMAVKLDAILGADGDILRALGYLPPEVNSQGLGDLRQRVEVLERQMIELTGLVASVVRLAPEAGDQSGEAQPG